MSKPIKQLGGITSTLNKKQIEQLAAENAQTVIESGSYDLLRVYVELKRYKIYLDALIDELKDLSTEQAKSQGENAFVYGDADIRVTNFQKFDFSGDMDWKAIDDEIAKLKKLKKAREQLLKESHKKRQFVDEETGEVVEGFELPVEEKKGIAVRI